MQAKCGTAMEGLKRGVAALKDLDTVALLEKSLDAGTTITTTHD